jgi:hypothetical protein
LCGPRGVRELKAVATKSTKTVVLFAQDLGEMLVMPFGQIAGGGPLVGLVQGEPRILLPSSDSSARRLASRASRTTSASEPPGERLRCELNPYIFLAMDFACRKSIR